MPWYTIFIEMSTGTSPASHQFQMQGTPEELGATVREIENNGLKKSDPNTNVLEYAFGPATIGKITIMCGDQATRDLVHAQLPGVSVT